MSERKIKLLIELVFIFILPLVFIATTSEISISREFEIINSENLPTLETKSISFDNTLIKYYRYPQYINYLNFNQLVQNGNFDNGYTGWYRINSSISVLDNICTLTSLGTVTSIELYNDPDPSFLPNVISGNKYLLCLNVKSSIDLTEVSFGGFVGVQLHGPITANTLTNISNILTCTNDEGNVLLDFYFRGYFNENDNVEISEIMLIDLTQMFGSGYEPTTIQELSNYIDLSQYYDFIESEVIIYESNNIVSENYEVNYTIWGKIKRLFIDHLDFNDNVLLDIIICYTVLWISMFLIWHLFYRFIDFIVHLADKKRC